MTPDRHSISSGWPVYWLLTYVLAFAVFGLLPFAGGLPAPDFLGPASSLLHQLYLLAINALIQGLALGTGQWLLLRRPGIVTRRFIPLTTLGWVLGLSLGLFIVFGISRLIPDLSGVDSVGMVNALNFGLLVINGVPFFIAGLILGGFQWMGLRRVPGGGVRWALASGLGFLLFLLARNGLTFIAGTTGASWLGAPVGLWAASLIPGLLTGGQLASGFERGGLGAAFRRAGFALPIVFLVVSLVISFMASEIGSAVELARAARPEKLELIFDSGLPADGQTETILKALVLNRDGLALPGQNIKFEIENRDSSFLAADGSQGVLPVDEGCIAVEQEVCLPSAIVQSGPDGMGEVVYRVPVWEAYMATDPVHFEAIVFQRDPDSPEGPAAIGEIYFTAP